MADRYFVGAITGTAGLWNATSSWSDTAGGASGFSVPVAGDNVFIQRDVTTNGSWINVNQSIGNIAKLTYNDTDPLTGYLHLAGTTAAATGTTWTLTAPVTIDVKNATTAGATNFFLINPSLSGAGQIIKIGPAMLAFDVNTTAQTAWTGGIDIQEGTIGVGSTATNRLGTGIIYMQTDTALLNFNATRTLTNIIQPQGTTAYLNAFTPTGPAYTFALFALTLSGELRLGASTRTINIGSTGVTVSGTLTGTAGFIKTGAGTLTLSNAANTISGTVTLTAGGISTTSTALASATVELGAGTLTTTTGSTLGALSGSTNYALGSTLTVGSAAATVPNLSATYSGVLSGSFLVTKAGTGTWTLDGANTNTGGLTISAGTVLARKGGATSGSLGGTTGTITLSGTLELNGNGTDQTFTKSGAVLNVSGGTIRNSSDTNTLIFSSAALSTSTLTVDTTGGKLILQLGNISGAAIGITKTGSATAKFDTTTASFGGKVTLSAGTTEVTKLADAGVSSSLGNGSTTPAIDLAAGATLSHVGTGNDSTSRVLNLTGGGTYTLDSSGVGGSITYAATPTFATAAANTIALTGSNTSTSNLLSGTIANKDGSNLTTVTKAGVGTWGFGAAATLTFTGGLSISAGELQLGATARTLTAPITISGGTLSNGSALLTATSVTLTGGKLTAPLTGTGTLTCSSGTSTVTPGSATGSNAQTGATTVSSGAVVRVVTSDAVDVSTAGNGRVLGNGTTTVAGTIRTGTSATSSQKGQARYNNLVLNSGARIEIGAA